MKKALSLILAAIMVLSLVACGGKNDTGNAGKEETGKTDTQKPDTGKTDTGAGVSKPVDTGADVKYKERVVIAYSDTLKKMDPQSNNTGVNGHIYELTHNTLVTCNYETNEIIPELAESWEVDGLTYTFKLRQDVTLYEGQKFTAEDVKFTYERAASTSYQFPKVQDIATIECVDDYTLKITLSKPNAEFLDLLCSPNMSILCSESVKPFDKAVDDEGAKNGTGAFHLTEWVPGEYCLVTRNDNYFEGPVPTKEIKYIKYSEASARVIALQTGEVDICMDVPAIEVAHVQDAAGCEMLTIPGTKLVYMAMNVNGYNKDVLEPKVRQALNYATDTDSIIAVLTEGYGQQANGCIPANIWGYSDSVETYSYDPEKAKSLLAEAGYGNGLDITFSYNAAIYPGLFELLQGMWAPIGINLTLSTDDATILSDQNNTKEYDLQIAQWSFSSIDNSLRSLWYTDSGSNRTLTADPELDAMLDAALQETDTTKRLEMYAEISQYLSDSGALVPLYVDTLLYGVRDNVSGYVFNANIRHDFKNVAVTE